MKRLAGVILSGSAIVSALLQAVCPFLKGSPPMGSSRYCGVPQPQGLAYTLALAFWSWWFLVRSGSQRLTTELAPLPSRSRRLLSIFAYTLAVAVATLLLSVVTARFVISEGCLFREVCSRAEIAVVFAFGFLFLNAEVVILRLGWTGRLPGFRGRTVDVSADD